jgi:hypothetical protein
MAFAVAPHGTAQQAVDQDAWDRLLRRYVAEGLVNYAGLKEEREPLDRYLLRLREVKVARLPSREERLAFWINAYNACVLKGVLDHYPLKSVRNVRGFFGRMLYPVGGKQLTLDEIEAEGRALGDWRIHFALVCASSSCPLLRSEAYVSDRLDDQLVDQVRGFLADPSRGLRNEEASGVLWLSKIFQWHAKDFVPAAPLTVEALLPVISPYLDPTLAQAIQQRRPKAKFLDYDWSINESPMSSAE